MNSTVTRKLRRKLKEVGGRRPAGWTICGILLAGLAAVTFAWVYPEFRRYMQIRSI